MVGQGPNHHCQEALKPTKVAIKELHDFGETRSYVTFVLTSLVFEVDRWEIVSVKIKRQREELKSFQSQQHPKCRYYCKLFPKHDI